MRASWIPFFLLGTLAWGQGKPAPVPARPSAVAPDQDDDDKPPAAASRVAPDAPVLTIIGFCPDQASLPAPINQDAPKAACQTVVTRAQFEKLANAISPGMRPQIQRQLANAYPRLLVLAHDAEQRGIDKTARVAELQRFARLQILSQEVVRELEQEASNVSDQEIHDYYRNNSSTFEQATLKRLFVPFRKQIESAPKETANDAAAKSLQADREQTMTKVAGELRARALAGEDFARLQQHAYDAAGIKAPVPSPDLGPVRRAKLPLAHQVAFDMKVGEISQVITDASGHYIYKLETKQLQPLDAVKEEIRSILQKQNTQQAMEKIQKSFTTKMNLDFFSTEPPQGDPKAIHQPLQPKP